MDSNELADSSQLFGRKHLLGLLVGCWAIVGIVALAAGPGLGDHEVIVAQTARQMLQQGGQWLMPHYLDTPFLVKPPLMSWLVAAASAVFPNTAAGLPVSDASARLPSLLATLLTVVVVFQLGRTMFDRRTAWVAAFVYATSLGAALYAFNATVEAALTLFCTWAFAEFWWAQQASTASARRWHLLWFYVALGLAMLAKGPMPMVMVALPIAVWWWTDRPVRLLAGYGPRAAGSALRLAVREAWPRLRTALGRLGLWWGVPLFLAIFVPWMLYVAGRAGYAWELWKYEYLQRMEGDYPGTGSSGAWYYIPILLGLALPWCLSVPAALAAPFTADHRGSRRPLTYLWHWVVIGLAFMSAMSFKKPYYVLPALPGIALLLAPILERLFFGAGPVNRRRVRLAVGTIIALLVVGCVALWFFGRAKYPQTWHETGIAWGTPFCMALVVIGVAAAGRWYLRGRRFHSFLAVGATCVTTFFASWIALGPAFSNTDVSDQLLAGLDNCQVPKDAAVYWAGLRPDGRVKFYGDREVRQVVDPYKLIAEQGGSLGRQKLKQRVGDEVCTLLESSTPVYIVLKRENLQLLRATYTHPPPAYELFSIDRGAPGRDEDDWVVVSNVDRKPVKTAAWHE